MSIDKKKILIVFPQQLFVRNFFSAVSLSELSTDFDIFVAFNEGKNFSISVPPANIPRFFYSYPSDLVRRHMDFMDVMVWFHRKESSSFLYRSKRMLHIYGYHYELLLSPLKYLYAIYKGGKKSIFKFSAHIFKDIILVLKRMFLYNKFTVNYVKYFLSQKITINPELAQIVDTVNPDLVVMPSGGFEPEGLDLARICKKRGIRTLFLVDNWDNLSSKTIFYARPDFITVIGRQSQ